MTGTSAADRAQLLASDPGRSVFVMANAGSGKTKVLIDRIARLLLAGARPESFLCITYTKAAAAEMQRRLYERLGEWSVQPDAALTAKLKALIGAEADDVRPPPDMLARARALFARALETPGGLRIQTIHAFCERLLARFPLEAGAAPGFRVADEAAATALIGEAWAAAVASPGAARDGLVRLGARLDADRLDRLLDAMAARREALAAFVAEAGGLAAAQARVRARHGDKGDPADVRAAALARVPWADLLAAAEVLASGAASDVGLAEQIRRAALDPDDFDAWLDITLTQDRTPKKRACTKAMLSRAPYLEALFRDEADRAVVARLDVLAAERAEDACAALAIAEALMSGYEASKARAGLVDFDDLIGLARGLLTASEAAPWVLYKLDGGIDHILVDEGQDTSPAQWALVDPLQAEFFSGEGAREGRRTVFAVGDVKQSIYGFQGADPDGFKRERQRLERRAGPLYAGPELQTSFRSCPEILQAVDALFQGIDTPGAPPDFDGARHTAHRAAETGLVEWWPATPRPDAAEPKPWEAPRDIETGRTAVSILARTIAEAVAGWIANGDGVWERGRLRPMRPGDVLLLVRSRGPVFSQLLRALKRAGLPVAGADRMVLSEEIAVQDLLALARVAVDPTDDLALACVLKSPLVGLTDDDADLFPLAFGRARGESLFSRLMASGDPKYAEAQALATGAVERVGEAPFAFFSWALERCDASGRSGWRRMLERCGAEARDPLEEFMERALNAPRDRPASLLLFLQAAERDETPVKREMEAAGDAIRVMTVHGSKGLEAPVVILADTCAAVDEKPAGGLFVGPDGPVWSPGKKEDDAVSASARAAAAERAWGEHLRLLYVAMTRARDRLIVAGRKMGQGDGNVPEDSWHRLVGRAMEAIGAPIKTPFGDGYRLGRPLRATEATREPPAMMAPLPGWAQRPASPADQATVTRRRSARPIDSEALRRGRLVHGLLQRLPDLAPSRRAAAARAWLATQGVTSPDALLAEAEAVLNHPDLAPTFGPASRAEAALVGRVRDATGAERLVRGVVDRLAITDGGVFLVEYKTDAAAPDDLAAAPGAHLAQIARYRAVLAQAFPDRAIVAALVYTVGPVVFVAGPSVCADALSS